MAFQPMKVTFWLSDVRSDLTHGAYLLARDLVFALTATLSLAIGIGANAAIFTVVDALLWRAPVGVEEPSRLVEIGQTLNGAGFHPMSYARYVDIGARTTMLERTYAFSRGSTSVVFEQGDAGVAVGIAIGLLVSTLASRALKTYLVGVIPTDPVTFVGVAVLFAVITLAACLVPSYAATRIRPTEALRVE